MYLRYAKHVLKGGMDHCDPKNTLEYSGVRQLLTRSAELHFHTHSNDIDPIDLIEGGPIDNKRFSFEMNCHSLYPCIDSLHFAVCKKEI